MTKVKIEDIPKKYNAHESEKKWQQYWISHKIYKFNPDSKAEVYSIDTPPPTVSGKMHIGHAFSYVQQDIVARFQRMLGKTVFYPFGTDDNGLATERLIEKTKKVKGSKMDRQEFVKLCLDTLEKELRPKYIADWKAIGMSCDWDIFYTTINGHSQAISQRSFIELYNDKRIYRNKTPIMICPQCSTAIAQVEMEDVKKNSTLNYIKAPIAKDEYIIYATTRPELIYGCVGVSIHEKGVYIKAKKGDETWILSKEGFEKFKDEWTLELKEKIRGKDLVDKTVTIPLSDAKIKITHDQESKTEYGTGVVYYCTYGGIECVDWMDRHKKVDPIHVMDISGKYNNLSGPYEGMNSLEARKQVLLDLEEADVLIKKEPVSHVVNVHERCGTDIEYAATEQWFIKYLDLKEKFLKDGAKLDWYPLHMKVRLDNWIKGLKWDWCISRQRFFGVPFPLWYCKDCSEVVLADEKDLPVDPLKSKPPIKECKCGCKEFIPEKDILDTWATSSLTPQLSTELFKDKPIFKKLFPMSLRPQAHDIITFWLFNTLVKSQLHHKVNPWKDVIISGHALDPHGRKMSKSKGNVVEPQIVIEKYSADAMRFWAAGSTLGDDLPYQEKDIVTGQKMITKLWNATKFAFMHLENYKNQKPKELATIDAWLLTQLNDLIKDSTNSYDKYGYSKPKLDCEKFFWHVFCDNYLEIVKDRFFNPNKYTKEEISSAKYTLYNTSLTVIKLIAPIMPHITEELYQLYFVSSEKDKSIHVSSWPEENKDWHDKKALDAGNLAKEVIAIIRKYKTDQQMPLNQELNKVTIKSKENKNLIELVLKDIQHTVKAKEIEVTDEDVLDSDLKGEVPGVGVVIL
jgi:valyl-tRNA synthetase